MQINYCLLAASLGNDGAGEAHATIAIKELSLSVINIGTTTMYTNFYEILHNQRAKGYPLLNPASRAGFKKYQIFFNIRIVLLIPCNRLLAR